MFGTALRMLLLTAVVTQFSAAVPTTVTVVAPFGGEPLTAEILGVDSQGRTTYVLEQDELEGSSTVALITGTLVEASDTMSYVLSFASASDTFYIEADCALQGGNGVCTGLDSNSQPITTTIPFSTLVLDVISTAVPSNSGASQSILSSSAPTSQPTSKSSSSQRISASGLSFTAFMTACAAYFLL
ncbi:hypothetical protein DFH07DRAFT_802063 [Mycena maculata]|uniref:Uncharacterized protein n=1 Tax=Mycena maculata TaxID=230809 RepID=A0AAD7JVN4_9AGAR|nr:hypothetical protein DFH07DRAFT_802063 [Mycena maculata]